jgi:uncharacterized protein YjbJ (UPF0337 family)
MKNSKSFEENWPQYRDKLKKEHPQLTDEDLKYEPGDEEEVLKRLQEKLNKTKHEIRNWLHIMG